MDTNPSDGQSMTTRSAPPTAFALVTSAQGGDRTAFELLLSQRLDRTHRTARAILGNDADARDATQDAWIAVWRQLPSLRDATAFEAWLDRIVVNACRMLLRRRGPVRAISIDAEFDVAAPAPGPEAVAERDALERAFEHLTVDQRAILVLHHLHHRPIGEIATALGIPEGTVKSRLHTARTALGKAVEDAR